MKNFDKTWPSEKGNGKTLQYSCCQTLWTVRKGKKPWHWKMSLPGWMEGVQYVIGEEWRAITNSSRKNEAPGPTWKPWSGVNVSGLPWWFYGETTCNIWDHLQYPAIPETQVWFLSQEDPLEKEMAAHSSIHFWKIPWAEEPGPPTVLGITKELDMTWRLKQNWNKLLVIENPDVVKHNIA